LADMLLSDIDDSFMKFFKRLKQHQTRLQY
jgi:hypothetical protein